MTKGFMNDLRWDAKHSEYVVRKQFTYFPKKMTSGKWVWWNNYYYVEDSMNADPRHMIMKITLYSEEEWFLHVLSKK